MVSNLERIFKIAKSEVKTVISDPGSILIMIGGIFMYSIFYLIPFANDIVREIPIGVVDNDNSALSREFVRNLNANEFVKVISKPNSIESAKEEYYRNEIRAIVVVPKDFERDIKRGKSTSIAAYEDSAFLIIYKQTATGIQTVASALGSKLEIASIMKKGFSKDSAIKIKQPFDLIQIPLFNPVGSYKTYLFPMVLIIILQQTMLVGGALLGGTLVERVRGVKQRNGNNLEVIKLNRVNKFSDKASEIVFGKAIAYVSLYICYAMIYFFIFPLVAMYNVNINIIPMFLLLIPFLFACAFLTQTFLLCFRQREYSMLMLVVTSILIVFLPGIIWPKECIPGWLLNIAQFIPATAGMEGLIRINQLGGNFSQVAGNIGNLVILCIIYYFTAITAVKKLQKETGELKIDAKN